MTTIEYLDQIRRIDKVVSNKMKDLSDNIRRLREAAGLSGVRYDGDRVQSSSLSDPTSKPAILLASMEQDVNRTVNEMLAVRTTIMGQIEMIRDIDHYDILFKHFVLHQSIGHIAGEWKFSWKQTNQVYKDALDAFERYFGGTYLSRERKIW